MVHNWQLYSAAKKEYWHSALKDVKTFPTSEQRVKKREFLPAALSMRAKILFLAFVTFEKYT